MAADLGAELLKFQQKVGSTIAQDALARMSKAAGLAGKDAALSAASDTLGADRAMSNFKGGKVALGAGFDSAGASSVVVKFRPAGLWVLAESGRKRSGPIWPRPGSGRRKGTKYVPGRAVMTPEGPRSRSSYGPSKGHRSISIGAGRARRDAPRAAHEQLGREIARALRG